MNGGPYFDAAVTYLAADWSPIPVRGKSPPPDGFTGYDGADPSRADVQAWCDGEEGSRNLAVRLPPDVIGLDVDAWGGKQGPLTMAVLECRLGALPPTYSSTSRDDGSRIGLYKVEPAPRQQWSDPKAVQDDGTVTGDVEVIHHGWRYVMAWPSVHPDTGATYRWHGPDGALLEGVPPRSEIPELPAAWAEHLRGGEASAKDGSVDDERAAQFLAALPVGAPCGAVEYGRARAFNAVSAGSRHDETARAVAHLVRLGEQGHAGVPGVLERVRERFVTTVKDARRGGEVEAVAEFRRLVTGAVALVLGTPTPPEERGCGCGWPFTEAATAPGGAESGSGPTRLATDLANPLRQAVIDLMVRRRAREVADELERLVRPKPAPDAGTLAELLARPSSTRWRVEGLLPAGGRLLWSAQRKLGKTTAVGNLCRSLLIGEPVLGRFPVAEPLAGRVVVLNYEVTGATFACWMADIGVPPERMHVVNLRGRRNLLADEASRQELVELIRAAEGEVLVVDPFGRAFTGRSQNDAAEITPWLVRLDEVADSAGVREVVLTAHAGWSGERIRGSSALEDWPDAIVTMTRDEESGERFLRAEGRDVDVEEDRLTYDSATRTLTLSGAGGRKRVRAETRLEDLARAVREAAADKPGLNVDEMREVLRGRGLHFQRNDVPKACALAVERGWVAQKPGARGAKKHFPPGHWAVVPTRTDPDHGTPPTRTDPSYRDGTGQGTGEDSTRTESAPLPCGHDGDEIAHVVECEMSSKAPT